MILLTAVGDIFPGNLPYHKQKYGIASNFAQHQGVPWISPISKCFKGADIGLANLESPLLYKDCLPQHKEFSGSEDFAPFIKNTGINLVSIANNHILEHGSTGFFSTLEILEKNGIKVIGKNTEFGSNILVVESKGISIAFAAFNDIRDIENPGLHSNFSESEVLSTLGNMKGVDFKVLVFHWGKEYVHIPSYEQVELAKRFINAGADVIIGHHPHVIQPVMRYKTGIALFSLGNFLFDMTYRDNVRIGMVAKISLKKGSKPSFELQGIRMSNDYSPQLMNKNDFDAIMSKHECLFEGYLNLKKSEYNLNYNSMVKKNRAIQRVFMKKELVRNLHRMTSNDRIHLINKAMSQLKQWMIK